MFPINVFYSYIFLLFFQINSPYIYIYNSKKYVSDLYANLKGAHINLRATSHTYTTQYHFNAAYPLIYSYELTRSFARESTPPNLSVPPPLPT